MTEEKQIEEMKHIACLGCKHLMECDESIRERCGFMVLIEALYAEGYRKQSEGEWLIKKHPLLGDYDITCSSCGKKERRGRAWSESWGISNFCPNCGAKMKGGFCCFSEGKG